MKTTTHNLIIKSLHDAQAACSCGCWEYVATGERTRTEVEKAHALHIADVADDYGHPHFGGMMRVSQILTLREIRAYLETPTEYTTEEREQMMDDLDEILTEYDTLDDDTQ